MSDHYIPDENWNPIPCDLFTWMEWMEKNENHLKYTEFQVGSRTVTISTVFLGLDHNFFHDGPPILYETMAFVTEPQPTVALVKFPYTFIGNSQVRAATKEEAIENHDRAAQLIWEALHALPEGAVLPPPLLGSGPSSTE